MLYESEQGLQTDERRVAVAGLSKCLAPLAAERQRRRRNRKVTSVPKTSSKRDRVVALLKSGLPPDEVARKMGIARSVVFGHCDSLIVSGKLRRSDVFYSIPQERRNLVRRVFRQEKISEEEWSISKAKQFEIDFETMVHYGFAGTFLGDLYEDIRVIEITFHERVCSALARALGNTAWWNSAVPEKIRAECERRQSTDREPSDSIVNYLNLADLTVLVDRQWAILGSLFPRSQPKTKSLGELRRLTTIRNWVMHPTRGVTPTEEDFVFVRRVKGYVGFA